MDWVKKGQELFDSLVRPYTDLARELAFLKKLDLKIRGTKIKLEEYHEELLFHAYEGKNVVVYKTRQSGYTTLLLLHILYILHQEYCTNSFKCTSNILFVEPNGGMCEDAKRKLKEIIDSTPLTYSMGYAKEVMKHITFTTYNRIDNLCGKCFDYAVYDEFALVEPSDFQNFFQCAFATMTKGREVPENNPPTGTSILVSSFSNENEEKAKREIEKFVKEIGGFEFMTTHWYEVPSMNKNLVWKKYEVEPTIDEEGNVRYDKERWQKRIADGWIPTSPRFERMCEILGEDQAKTELLN